MKYPILILSLFLCQTPSATADDLFLADGRKPGIIRTLTYRGRTYEAVQIAGREGKEILLSTKQGELRVEERDIPSLWLSAMARREAAASKPPVVDSAEEEARRTKEMALDVMREQVRADEKFTELGMSLRKANGDALEAIVCGFRNGRQEVLLATAAKVAWVQISYFHSTTAADLRAYQVSESPEQDAVPTKKPPIKERIAKRAEDKWPEDARMQVYEIKRQTEAWDQLTAWDNSPPYGLTPVAFQALSDKAEGKWRGDYVMQVYHIKSEVDAREKLKTLKE